MRNRAVSLLKSADLFLSPAYLKVFGERNSLITLLFHGLFRDKAEIALDLVNAQQSITVSQFRGIVAYFRKHGYQIASPVEILEGLDPGQKYVLITFDDGYYSSNHALPVLREFGVPAVFFVSINHVLRNKCFWWDVLWRERKKAGASNDAIRLEGERLKSHRNDEIEARLMADFGESAFSPMSDIDRPLTVPELQELSREETVFIGNHTMDHAILTNYDAAAARNQIERAQEQMLELTGHSPEVIAWPNGNYSNEIISFSRSAGLRLGITIEPRKNYLPIDPASYDCMRLGRFTPMGNKNLERQLDLTRADVSIRQLAGRLRRR